MLKFDSCAHASDQAQTCAIGLLQVLIAGSETTAEHRAQLYSPDYFFTGKPRPVIDSAPRTIGYNESFNISFSNSTTIDRVVFNRLASATHGIHFDQRQVVLDFSIQGNSVEAMSPPDNNVGPPGQYQLFISSEGFPSRAEIITLQLASSAKSDGPLDGNKGSGLPIAAASSK